MEYALSLQAAARRFTAGVPADAAASVSSLPRLLKQKHKESEYGSAEKYQCRASSVCPRHAPRCRTKGNFMLMQSSSRSRFGPRDGPPGGVGPQRRVPLRPCVRPGLKGNDNEPKDQRSFRRRAAAARGMTRARREGRRDRIRSRPRHEPRPAQQAEAQRRGASEARGWKHRQSSCRIGAADSLFSCASTAQGRNETNAAASAGTPAVKRRAAACSASAYPIVSIHMAASGLSCASRAQGSIEADAAASAVLSREATRGSLQRQRISHLLKRRRHRLRMLSHAVGRGTAD